MSDFLDDDNDLADPIDTTGSVIRSTRWGNRYYFVNDCAQGRVDYDLATKPFPYKAVAIIGSREDEVLGRYYSLQEARVIVETTCQLRALAGTLNKGN